jgi:hypothetical protein
MGYVSDPIDSMNPGPYGRPRVRFSAIGDARGLLISRPILWFLTAVLLFVCNGFILTVAFPVYQYQKIGRPGGFEFINPVSGDPTTSAVGTAVSSFVSWLILGGMFRMSCAQIRGRAFGIETFLSVLDVLPNLLLGSLLYAFVTLLGFGCLVIPGFIAQGVLMFMLPLIVDARMPAGDAMAASWRSLKGQWLHATLFHAVATFFAGLGGCCCFPFGIAVTAPLYCLSITVLYRDFFLSQKDGA